MTKDIVLRIFMSIIILSILCLEPSWISIAEDCQECDGKGTPTYAGNAEYSWGCECTDVIPTIYDNDLDDLIPSAGSVNLWVDSGGLSCPPYTWSVSSTGWSLNANETENDLEIVTLSLINTSGKTCGTHYNVYCTVTVTDNCGETDYIIFRYSGGTFCDESTICDRGGSCSNTYFSGAIGKYRYRTTHYFFRKNIKCDATCVQELLAVNNYYLINDDYWYCDDDDYVWFHLNSGQNYALYSYCKLIRQEWKCSCP